MVSAGKGRGTAKGRRGMHATAPCVAHNGAHVYPDTCDATDKPPMVPCTGNLQLACIAASSDAGILYTDAGANRKKTRR